MIEKESVEHRSDDDIVRYYEKIQPHDMFGIWGTELMLRLPLNKASRFMAKDHGWDEESWAKCQFKKDSESIINEMEDYFQFATENAIAHRGYSSSKAIHHYLAWSWLIDDMELFGYLMNPKNYPNYGAPMIMAVAQKYEFMDLLPSNPIDHEVLMRMSQGQICSTLCKGGCAPGAPGQFRPMGIRNPTTKLILPR